MSHRLPFFAPERDVIFAALLVQHIYFFKYKFKNVSAYLRALFD